MLVFFVVGLILLVMLNLLILLGTIRELVIVRSELRSVSPESRTWLSLVGREAPEALRGMWGGLESPPVINGLRVVVFVAEGCEACESLLDGLASTSDYYVMERVAVVASPSNADAWSQRLRSLGCPVVEDSGEMFEALRILATPTCVVISRKGEIVDYRIGGDAAWIKGTVSMASPNMFRSESASVK